MLNINQIIENTEELEDEFYGKEEGDFEGGVCEDNYECAEWSRSNVDGLFLTIRKLANEVLILRGRTKALGDSLSTATNLLSEAHDIMDDVHLYETDLYREISKYFDGEDE